MGGMIQTASVLESRLFGAVEANERIARECGLSLEAMRAYLEARDVPKMLQTIQEAGGRAALIVRNMLGFARKSDIAKTSCDLAALMDATIELAATDYDLKKKHDFKSIDVVREYAPDMPKTPCEPQKIQQVLFNLLKNAADALHEAKLSGVMENRTPCIVVRTFRDGKHAVMEVEDNGLGMDPTIESHVFEPFYTTKQVGKGTGLGLSICYFIIVDNHGGRIDVSSQLGSGTRFSIYLPLVPGEA